MRRLSPIEMMIDQATGFTPRASAPAGAVTLRCPACERTKPAQIDETDPPGTVIVEAPCNDCIDKQTFEIKYFDATGVEIDPSPYLNAV